MAGRARRAGAVAAALSLGGWLGPVAGSAAPLDASAGLLPHPDPQAPAFIDASTTVVPPDWSALPDFTALRLGFAARRDFEARCDGSPADDFMPPLDAGRFLDAAAVARQWLERCPVDARVHQWAASAYYRAGMQSEFAMHARWHAGLLASIEAGGDGASPATAYRVISLMEPHLLLQQRGWKLRGQSIVEGEPTYERLEAEDSAGQRHVLYFDPRWYYARLRERSRGGG